MLIFWSSGEGREERKAGREEGLGTRRLEAFVKRVFGSVRLGKKKAEWSALFEARFRLYPLRFFAAKGSLCSIFQFGHTTRFTQVSYTDKRTNFVEFHEIVTSRYLHFFARMFVEIHVLEFCKKKVLGLKLRHCKKKRTSTRLESPSMFSKKAADLPSLGQKTVPRQVVCDRKIITARVPQDLIPFCKAIIKEMSWCYVR